MINFYIFVFILYAVSYSAKAILLGSKRRQQHRRKPCRSVNLTAKKPCKKVKLGVKCKTTAKAADELRMAA